MNQSYELDQFAYLLVKPMSKRPAVKADQPPTDAVTAGAPASGGIEHLLRGLADGAHNRNISIFKVVMQLRDGRFTAEDLEELLGLHADRCKFDRAELRELVRGACKRYGIGTNREELRYTAKSLGQILDGRHTEVSWLVDELLPSVGLALLVAHGGVGKTWILIALTVMHLMGGELFGRKVAKGRVLYVDEEMSERYLGYRIDKIISGMAAGAEVEKEGARFVVSQGVNLNRPESVQALRELVEEFKPTLIIIDSLVRVHRADENSSGEMANVFDVLRRLSNDFGCLILAADHLRKFNEEGSFGDPLRGSTDKRAAVDSILLVKKVDKASQELEVTHFKSRQWREQPSFALRIEDLSPNSVAVTFQGEVKPPVEKADPREAVLSYLANGEAPLAQILGTLQGLGLKAAKIKETLKTLCFEELVELDKRKEGEGRRGLTSYYFLSGQGPTAEVQTEPPADGKYPE